MEMIKGVTFKLEYNKLQPFAGEETKKSLIELVKTTACNTIILAFGALQDTPQSETIDYVGKYTPTETEIEQVIGYARELDQKVILKPMLNCRNGVWRAHINFFDLEVPCEPCWSKWFQNYTDYILKFAALAQRTKCEMYMVGCELVQTERKEMYWRNLIAKVRGVYKGLLTYNTDKYQEAQVKWWDSLDVISSSGYYPQSAWKKNLDRISKVVEQYKKPFFFAECGCMCVRGCEEVPNDWTFKGEIDETVQQEYYRVMFKETAAYPFVGGFGIWDWQSDYRLHLPERRGYSIYHKSAQKIISEFYKSAL